MQWSSVVLGRNGTHIAFVDVEQANALSFLMARGLWAEMPIFSYAEFMIRGAEALYDDGDLLLAAALSERANARLREYCRYCESGSIILRPKAVDPVLLELMEANVLLSFIIGHELGHLLQQVGNAGVVALFDWVVARYDESHLDKSGQIARERFLGPEIVQKFDSDGTAAGYAVQGTKLARLMPGMRGQQIKEVQSDALGVIMSSAASIAAGIRVEILFGIFLAVLENTEMLMVLRRLLPRLPRGEKRAAIPLENTSLIARQFLFLRLVRGLKDGSVPVPVNILHYWSTLPEETLKHFETLIDDGRLEQIGLRSGIMVRGSIELALQGSLGKAPVTADLVEKLGMVAGNLIVASAHLGYPEATYMVERSFGWTPSDDNDGVLYGFASAVRDICDLAASEKRPRQSLRRADILRNGEDARFVEFLRSVRTQVSLNRLNPEWASRFEHLLREPIAAS
ncbi:hypothetical protein FRZ44_33040 [Hypericibacter terrae]|uniref:Uncharacterized protein n=2 Tax=Hypericibacter terrae TaxID=2602015 RepID=A0A5J6MPM5_9PROT|nr:hypothetical protein FRZ44_33040 [Hypericibacter terrae]